jgi:hypothetical protein
VAKLRQVLVSSILFAAGASGCVLGAGDEPPAAPGPLPEVRYAAPAPGMVWIPGAWHWDGVRHVWVPGRWESPRS